MLVIDVALIYQFDDVIQASEVVSYIRLMTLVEIQICFVYARDVGLPSVLPNILFPILPETAAERLEAVAPAKRSIASANMFDRCGYLVLERQ